jgi:D-glycero-D-manno-heptose 1,7-bisphosphate phosphatase
MKPAVFLDRDGTICEEVGYMNHIDRYHLYPWSAEAIRKLNRAGLPTVIVTNQSGIARGYFPESFVSEVHQMLTSDLARRDARVDAIYYCPHHPDGCIPGLTKTCMCRKPGIGMIERAARELNLDPASSFVVGDRYSDIQLGFNAGARSIMVLTGYGKGEYKYQKHSWSRQPDHVADDLGGAVDWILGQLDSPLEIGRQE